MMNITDLFWIYGKLICSNFRLNNPLEKQGHQFKASHFPKKGLKIACLVKAN